MRIDEEKEKSHEREEYTGKDQCNIQCDDIDSYEYAVECHDYIKEEDDE